MCVAVVVPVAGWVVVRKLPPGPVSLTAAQKDLEGHDTAFSQNNLALGSTPVWSFHADGPPARLLEETEFPFLSSADAEGRGGTGDRLEHVARVHRSDLPL